MRTPETDTYHPSVESRPARAHWFRLLHEEPQVWPSLYQYVKSLSRSALTEPIERFGYNPTRYYLHDHGSHRHWAMKTSDCLCPYSVGQLPKWVVVCSAGQRRADETLVKYGNSSREGGDRRGERERERGTEVSTQYPNHQWVHIPKAPVKLWDPNIAANPGEQRPVRASLMQWGTTAPRFTPCPQQMFTSTTFTCKQGAMASPVLPIKQT